MISCGRFCSHLGGTCLIRIDPLKLSKHSIVSISAFDAPNDKFAAAPHLISSNKTGIDPPTNPLPNLILSTTFGFTFDLACLGVKSSRSFGVNERAHSMMTSSSGVIGYVRMESIRGALLPRVNVVSRMDSTGPKAADFKASSTEATTVAVTQDRKRRDL